MGDEYTEPKKKDEMIRPSTNVQSNILSGTQISLPNVALLLMLIGVLAPSVYYSVTLRSPTPDELLIAICIALFSSVLFLWIMDATSIIRFRNEWISKAIWGTAIASILGTSVGVYNNAFSARKYPYEGLWDISINSREKERYIAKNSVVVIYSEKAETYWGYGSYEPAQPGDNADSVWLKIVDFQPEDGNITIETINHDNIIKVYQYSIKGSRHGKLFQNDRKEKTVLNMSRTK